MTSKESGGGESAPTWTQIWPDLPGELLESAIRGCSGVHTSVLTTRRVPGIHKQQSSWVYSSFRPAAAFAARCQSAKVSLLGGRVVVVVETNLGFAGQGRLPGGHKGRCSKRSKRVRTRHAEAGCYIRGCGSRRKRCYVAKDQFMHSTSFKIAWLLSFENASKCCFRRKPTNWVMSQFKVDLTWNVDTAKWKSRRITLLNMRVGSQMAWQQLETSW